MRRVTCQSCGRSYDYDAEDLCPRCGCFNSPPDQGATALEREMLGRFSFAAKADTTHAHSQASEVFRHAQPPKRPAPPKGAAVNRPQPGQRGPAAGQRSPAAGARQNSAKGKNNSVSLLIGVILFILWCLIMAFAR